MLTCRLCPSQFFYFRINQVLKLPVLQILVPWLQTTPGKTRQYWAVFRSVSFSRSRTHSAYSRAQREGKEYFDGHDSTPKTELLKQITTDEGFPRWKLVLKPLIQRFRTINLLYKFGLVIHICLYMCINHVKFSFIPSDVVSMLVNQGCSVNE